MKTVEIATFKYLNALIGKTVEYDFGGSRPLLMTLAVVKQTPWYWTDEDGVEQISYTFAISEDGWSWYTATKLNVIKHNI